jgi:hypothetical protein
VGNVSRYVFDIETNGFLDQLDRVHCLVLKDIDTGELLVVTAKPTTTYNSGRRC